MSENAPLYNELAEQSVLGGLLIENDAWDQIADVVSEADFYPREHRAIFRAIYRLLEAGKPADLLTVAEFLDANKALEDGGGIEYIGGLVQNIPSAANIGRYAEIVRNYSLLRMMAVTAREITEKIHNRGEMQAREMLDFAQSKWMAVDQRVARDQKTLRHIRDVLPGVVERVDAMAQRDSNDVITGLRTGIDELDEMTTGMQAGQLIIVAARPSMGKTSLALNISESVGMRADKNVLFFSLEMINEQLGIRMLSSISRLNALRVSAGKLNDMEWEQLTGGLARLNGAGIYLDEESRLTVNDIRARSRRLYRELGGQLHLIVIDYIGLIEVEGRDTRANEMAAVSRALKMLAKELHIPVIALAQLNRGLENRPNKRPIMSDLRDSGGIEQDADNIYFIYRDEVYNPDSQYKGTAEIIVGKQRNGPIGTVRATFINHLARFENWMPAYDSGDHPAPQGGKNARKFPAKNDYPED